MYPIQELTTAELAVLQALANGYSGKELQIELGVKQSTINNYITSINKKLCTKNRTHAAVIACHLNLISISLPDLDGEEPVMKPPPIISDVASQIPERLLEYESLTDRERDVCRCLKANPGITNPEIGEALHITKDAVRSHLRTIYGKLGIEGEGANKRVYLVLLLTDEDLDSL